MSEFETATNITEAEDLDVHADCDQRIGGLETERDQARDRAAQAFSRLESFKQRVREIAIQAHHDGHWCKDGMNEKFDELGLEPYVQRFTVALSVELVMEVESDSPDDAADTARSDISVTSDSDYYLDVADITVRSVDAVEED